MGELPVNLKLEAFAAQRELLAHPARFHVLWCGRRWGKTTYCRMRAEVKGVEQPGRLIWWVAPQYWQAMRAFDKMIPELGDLIVSSRRSDPPAHTLWNGSKIEFRSAERPDTLRGEGVDHVVVDEAGQVVNYAFHSCLYPTLMDKRGTADIIGSPVSDPEHWFWKMFHEGLSGKDPDVVAKIYPSWTNPYLDPEEIEQARKRMPEEDFNREIGAEPSLASSTTFPPVPLREMLSYATDPKEREVTSRGFAYDVWEEPVQGEQYVIGVDVSEKTKTGDYSVASLGRRIPEPETGERGVLAEVAQFRERIEPWLLGQVLIDMAVHYNHAYILIERNGPGLATIGYIRNRTYPRLARAWAPETGQVKSAMWGWRTTETSKHILTATSRAYIQDGRLRLASRQSIKEFLAVRSEQSGKWVSEGGAHDDCVIAVGLMIQAHVHCPFAHKHKEAQDDYYWNRVLKYRRKKWIEKITGKPAEEQGTLWRP